MCGCASGHLTDLNLLIFPGLRSFQDEAFLNVAKYVDNLRTMFGCPKVIWGENSWNYVVNFSAFRLVTAPTYLKLILLELPNFQD